MTRSLHVIPSLGSGGSERSLVELLPGLREAGIEPVVVCFDRRSDGFHDELVAAGVPVELVSGRVPSRVTGLRGLIARRSIDVVHTSVFAADVPARIAAVGSGVPVLTSLVNTSYDPARRSDPSVTRWRLEAVRIVDGWTARNLTSHFHAVTETVATSAVAQLGIPPGRITVVERGRDPRRLGSPGAARRAAARDRLGVDRDAELVLAIGRQFHQKGLDVLIRATSRLVASRPRLQVLVAGAPGPATPRLLEVLQQTPGAAGVVRLLGHRDDVGDLLAAADVLAMPSRYEGAAGAAVEAMAMAVPVVASDLPSLREVLAAGRAGLLFPVEDDGALADALGLVLADEALRLSLGRRGRARFEERHDLPTSIARFADLLRRVAATAAGGRGHTNAGRVR